MVFFLRPSPFSVNVFSPALSVSASVAPSSWPARAAVCRAPPGVVGAVQRHPGTEVEVIDEVSLNGVERVLGEIVAAEEVVIVGEERHAREQLQR